MAEITGHEPIEDAAVLLQTDMGERFKIDGFKGLRRVEINRFAKAYFITEANPNGTIESFKDDMGKPALDSMMGLYLSQGKFGADPFNLRPQDKMADLQRQIEELKAAWQGPQANPATETYTPPTVKITEPMVHAPSVPLIPGGEDGPQKDHETMSWDEIRTKAKDMGIKTFHKQRPTIIAEIEAKEAE